MCVENSETLRIAILLPNALKQNQRTAIPFLVEEGQNSLEIHPGMKDKYG